MERLHAAWTKFWFCPAPPTGLLAARTIVCLQALWIVLSRPDLPTLSSWPPEFWLGVDPWRRARFLFPGLPAPLETALYVVLVAALVATLLGKAVRASAAVAATLLYHFAPFEEILAPATFTFFRGLTIPLLALYVLAFAPAPDRHAGPSAEHRWPLALILFLFVATYPLAALSKLHDGGLAWISADNIRAIVLTFTTLDFYPLPWAGWVASSPWLCGAIASGTIAIELAFPLVLCSRAAARILLPLAIVGHYGIVKTLGVGYLSAPLLLLLVDWNRWLGRRATP